MTRPTGLGAGREGNAEDEPVADFRVIQVLADHDLCDSERH